MVWPKITGAHVTSSTQFGGDVTNKLADLFSGVDITQSPYSITDKPLINTPFRYQPDKLELFSSDTAAYGQEATILGILKNSTNNEYTGGWIGIGHSDPTAGSEDTIFDVSLLRAGAAVQALYFENNKFYIGASSFLGLDPTGLTAQRLFTFPDLSTKLAGLSVANTFLTQQTIQYDTSGALLALYRPSSTVGNSCRFDFTLNNSTPTQKIYARMQADIAANTPGDEDGKIKINVMKDGALAEVVNIWADGAFDFGGPTHRVRVKETGLTALRTFVFPDQDTLVAGQDFANVFSVAQKFDNYLDSKVISAPASPASGYTRIYSKQVDSNNDGLFVKLKLNGAVQEIRIA
jgi:hypothetical protein